MKTEPTTTGYFAHPTAVIDQPVDIGKDTMIWHFCHIMAQSHIGERCNLGQNVFIASGVVVGNNVKIQNNVSLYSGVTCDDDVFLGPSCVFTNIINPRSAVNRKNKYTETHIGQGATIGANATIVCGNSIGRYAFIGAGSVITHHVPDYALVKGNPARQCGWMSEFGHRLEFNPQNEAICPESGQRYRLEKDKVSRIF